MVNLMKYNLLSAAIVSLLACDIASASVVVGDLPARPGENGAGIGYGFQIYQQSGITDTFSGTVGSKAWSDPQNSLGPLGVPLGWTHTSVWAYIKVTDSGNYRISVSPDASNLVPAFTLWKGADNSGFVAHEYAQVGVPAFVNAPGFAYINHVTLGPGAYTGANASLTLFLNAGEYTVALGGNDGTTLGHQAGYSFSMAPVPVPGSIWLFGSALTALISIRRKAAYNN